MAKQESKKPEKNEEKKEEQESVKDAPEQEDPFSKLPPEVQQKLKVIKEKLDIFQKKVIEKFDKYIVGIALLPPPRPHPQGEQHPAGQPTLAQPQPHPTLTSPQPLPQLPPQPQPTHGEYSLKPDDIAVLVLVDDSDSKKMTKQELKQKLSTIIASIAKDTDERIKPDTIILSELWQSCYDAKYEMNQLIAISAPVYDTGMLAAIKIAEIHKTMVLKKFEKYIVSYVLSGSLLRGQATATSDIDVFIVIDDTDVKKMTRAELKDKLRAIIIGMGFEAGNITGIKNKLNIQVYILTDFWDSLREANPIIFTLLRDGVPFFDRGIFMPWKQLLKMGKIKPSAEAIDMFMSSGDQMLKRIEFKIKDIGMEDTYYAILTPSQAALMMYGIPPPAPKETAQLMRDIFVKKEKFLEEDYVKILEKNIKIRKDLEHGTKKVLTGKEVDELVANAQKYLDRIKTLFEQIEKLKEQEDILHIYNTVVTVVRDVLKLEGYEKVRDEDILKHFSSELIHSGKVPQKYLEMLKDIHQAKKDYETGKLTKPEVDKNKKHSREFIKFLVEYMQRKRGRELERTKVRVKHGNRYGEIILLDKVAFIIHDIDNQDKEISKAPIKENGGLGVPERTTLEELEKALAKIEMFPKVYIKQAIFEDLKNIFGKDVEVLINF